jgi:hypothetical protein
MWFLLFIAVSTVLFVWLIMTEDAEAAAERRRMTTEDKPKIKPLQNF